MASLNETWEDKLAKTQEIHMAREKALEEMGITLNKDRTLVGVHAPKKWPHLVNLNEDPLQNECLLYAIPQGKTVVGNTRSSTANIRLSSPQILSEHCILLNQEGKVSMQPCGTATVLVNGKPIPSDTPTELESGFRIIIDWHVFRFSSPESVRAKRMRESACLSASDSAPDLSIKQNGSEVADVMGRDSDHTIVDWTFARREALSRLTFRGDDLDALDDQELDDLFQGITRARSSRRRPDSQLGTPSRIRAETPVSLPEVTVSSRPQTPPPAAGGTGEEETSQVRRRERPTSIPVPQSSEEDDPVFLSPRKPRWLASTDQEDPFIQANRHREQHSRQNSQELARMAEEIRVLRQVALQSRFQSLHVRLDGVLLDREKHLAREAVDRWRQLKAVGMAKTMLSQASTVYEMARLAQKADIGVSYHLVTSRGCPVSTREPELESVHFDAQATEPMSRWSTDVVTLVVDSEHNRAFKWPWGRTERQLAMMRAFDQATDTAHRPPLDEAFRGSPCHHFTHLGSAIFALDPCAPGKMTIPIYQFETLETVGSVTANIRWYSESPSGDDMPHIKTFTLVLDNVQAFSRDDVSTIHMQLRMPTFGMQDKRERLWTSSTVDLSTQTPQALSLKATFAIDIEHMSSTEYVRVDFFGTVKEAFIQNLLVKCPRPAESDSVLVDAVPNHQRHTIQVHLSILELNSQGEFTPTEFDRTDEVFLLRQGRQRQLKIRIQHQSARLLDYRGIGFISISRQTPGDQETRETYDPVELVPMHAATPDYTPDGRGCLSVTCKFEDLPGMEKRNDSLPCQTSFQLGFQDYQSAPVLIAQTINLRILGRESRRRSGIIDYLRFSRFTPEMSQVFQLETPIRQREAAAAASSHQQWQSQVIQQYLSLERRQLWTAQVEATRALLRSYPFIKKTNTEDQDGVARRGVESWKSFVQAKRDLVRAAASSIERMATQDHIHVSRLYIP